MPRNLRQRRQSSDSEDDNADNKTAVKERIEDLKFLQKLRNKPSGVDPTILTSSVDLTSTNKQQHPEDPWKLQTGGLVDMKRIQKKSNDVVNNMNANFARETNQRDEDAEMQKFIEEQLRLRKAAEAAALNSDSSKTEESSVEKKIKRPDDALFDVPKHLIMNQSKHKSEETLSEQMLSGIPEVDLGVQERIRNIEETERAKHRLVVSSSDNKQKVVESSSNYVQHKRFDDTLINPERNIAKQQQKANAKKEAIAKQDANIPVVGDAEKHEALQKTAAEAQRTINNKDLKRPNVDRASDDYCLERFKKNMRFNRNSKIKIA